MSQLGVGGEHVRVPEVELSLPLPGSQRAISPAPPATFVIFLHLVFRDFTIKGLSQHLTLGLQSGLHSVLLGTSETQRDAPHYSSHSCLPVSL